MNMLRLEARSATSDWMRLASPPIAVAMTVLTGLLIFALLGKDPVQGFQVFFINPVKSFYGLTELMLKATPLAMCAIGLAIGFRAKVWNIGAEGQFIVGAIFATGVGLYLGSISIISLVLMMLAGMLGGALWASIAALLKTRFNTNEILVSLMLVYVAELLVSWVVFGPWKDPQGFNFPQTQMFESTALLPVLVQGTRLNLAFGLAIVLLIAGHVMLTRTYLGYKMRVAGESPKAAGYAGISTKTMTWVGLLVGGACAGLAGMAEVAGPMGQLTDKVGSGYGFAAIIIAFVGRLHPVGIGLAALLMALFYIGGEQAQQYLGLPGAISKVFQGLLLFYLLAADVLIQYRIVFSGRSLPMNQPTPSNSLKSGAHHDR
jgi:general nucleoside transport system permease protein